MHLIVKFQAKKRDCLFLENVHALVLRALIGESCRVILHIICIRGAFATAASATGR